MSLGPVELLVVKFPGNEFKGEIGPALADLVESGTVRVIDLLFIMKTEQGEVIARELSDLDSTGYVAFDPLVSEITGLLSDDDVQEVADMLEPNSSGALLLFENTWAKRFRDTLENANAELIMIERIPHQVVEEALEYQAQNAEAAPAEPGAAV